MAHGKVRIVDVPPGEAPDWVREKWVGLELPLAQSSQAAVKRRVAGVLSGPKSILAGVIGSFMGRYHHQSGFLVPVLEALNVLESVSPEAAEWWRTNAPSLCKPRRNFMFQAPVCKLVAE